MAYIYALWYSHRLVYLYPSTSVLQSSSHLQAPTLSNLSNFSIESSRQQRFELFSSRIVHVEREGDKAIWQRVRHVDLDAAEKKHVTFELALRYRGIVLLHHELRGGLYRSVDRVTRSGYGTLGKNADLGNIEDDAGEINLAIIVLFNRWEVLQTTLHLRTVKILVKMPRNRQTTFLRFTWVLM